MLTDAELVASARSGDRGALSEIYDGYADRLFDLCTSVLRDPEDAFDTMVDTFVLAALELYRLRRPEKLGPWLPADEAVDRRRGRGPPGQVAPPRRRACRRVSDLLVVARRPAERHPAHQRGSGGAGAARSPRRGAGPRRPPVVGARPARMDGGGAGPIPARRTDGHDGRHDRSDRPPDPSSHRRPGRRGRAVRAGRDPSPAHDNPAGHR